VEINTSPPSRQAKVVFGCKTFQECITNGMKEKGLSKEMALNISSSQIDL